MPSLKRVEVGIMCFAQCITVSFSSLSSSLLSTIDLPHLTLLILGLSACDGESFGYVFKNDLDEINKSSEFVMESETLLLL